LAVPPPDQTTPLTQILRAEIAARGPIPFRDFMAAALYHPEHGYYTSGRATIGRHGDFITSVSVGRLFGTLLARQFIEMWDRMERPATFSLIEQGAHDGTLMEDVLLGLRSISPECSSAARPTIIEPAAVWREKQRARLKDWPVEWADSVETLAPFTGIHFSNELLDAFPVHLVRRGADAWFELHVEWKDNRFTFVDRPVVNAELRARLAQIAAPTGYLTEVCLEATWWMKTLAQKLTRGYVLAIDYGFAHTDYYRPERTTGTLEALAAHRRESDPLARPGDVDLTAHVDFTALAEAARQTGLQIEGFTDQHHFMVGLAAQHFPDGVQPSASDMRAFQTLAHPTMLGRSFKAFASSRSVNSPMRLAGFSQACPADVELGLTDR
jgi:SAM-dependent MidA family methyltransferase